MARKKAATPVFECSKCKLELSQEEYDLALRVENQPLCIEHLSEVQARKRKEAIALQTRLGGPNPSIYDVLQTLNKGSVTNALQQLTYYSGKSSICFLEETVEEFVTRNQTWRDVMGCHEDDDDNFHVWVGDSHFRWHVSAEEPLLELDKLKASVKAGVPVLILHQHDCAGMACSGRGREGGHGLFVMTFNMEGVQLPSPAIPAKPAVPKTAQPKEVPMDTKPEPKSAVALHPITMFVEGSTGKSTTTGEVSGSALIYASPVHGVKEKNHTVEGKKPLTQARLDAVLWALNTIKPELRPGLDLGLQLEDKLYELVTSGTPSKTYKKTVDAIKALLATYGSHGVYQVSLKDPFAPETPWLKRVTFCAKAVGLDGRFDGMDMPVMPELHTLAVSNFPGYELVKVGEKLVFQREGAAPKKEEKEMEKQEKSPFKFAVGTAVRLKVDGLNEEDVMVASAGEEGLVLAAKQTPDGVLYNVDIDGTEVLMYEDELEAVSDAPKETAFVAEEDTSPEDDGKPRAQKTQRIACTNPVPVCSKCDVTISHGVFSYSKQVFHSPLCMKCQKTAVRPGSAPARPMAPAGTQQQAPQQDRPIHIGFVGSRSCDGPDWKEYMEDILERLLQKHGRLVIVSGEQPKGADGIAKRWALANRHRGVGYLPCPPKTWTPRDLFARNTDIVNKSDIVIAIWDGESRGTVDTMRKTLQAGKRLFDMLAQEQGRPKFKL